MRTLTTHAVQLDGAFDSVLGHPWQ